MDRDGVKHLANLLDAEISSAPMSAKWLNITCPFAAWTHQHGSDRTPSFGVKINKYGVSQMFCLSCLKGGGDLDEVLIQLKHLGAELPYKELRSFAQSEWDGSELPQFDDDEETDDGLFPFDEGWLDSFPLAVNNGHALVYLESREGGPVPKSVSAMLGLRYDPFERRVAFPIRGEDKRLYGLHGRAIDSGVDLPYWPYAYKKRRNPHVPVGLDTVDWNKPVVVAESVFDMARTKQVYRNVITPMHAQISADMFEFMTSGFEFITLFDGDKAGSFGRQKFTKWAGKKRIVEHVYLPDGMDAGGMTAEALAEELAPFVDLDTLLL
jgi:hypothetical protein